MLRVTSLLAREPEGVRADEVAEALSKSVSTAYNLLASLCEEGVAMRGQGAVYRLTPGFRRMVASGAVAQGERAVLTALVEELLARTHKRSYLGIVENGRMQLAIERGLQGMARLPGLGPELGDSAHALALGKVTLAFAGQDAVDGYVRRGLRAFTPNTIACAEELRAELHQVRNTGLATDRVEFGEDCCGLAAPLVDDRGRFIGALGISMSRRAYDDEHESLAETLRDVARGPARASSPPRFQPCADSRKFLDPAREPVLASSKADTVR